MENNAVAPNVNNTSFPYTMSADPIWIAAAQGCGFTGNSLTRDDCIIVREKTGHKLPRWLMKDSSRRIGRGMYACPELEVFNFGNAHSQVS